MELRHESGFLTTEDGAELFWQGLSPRNDARASVALVHGYNSFSDYMLPMMASLARQGLACYAVDYRGHGLSEGLPRHVFSFQEYLADVQALCRHVSDRAGDQQVFIFGNSLGGLISSVYGLFHPDQLSGTVLTAPFFGPAFRVPRVLDYCARAVSYCHPRFRIPRRHAEQPEHTTVRWWTETSTAQQVLRQQAEKFTLPVLVLHGQKDPVACPIAAASMTERLGSKDKTFQLLPEAGHYDLDPCRGSSWWSQVCDWLLARTPAGA